MSEEKNNQGKKIEENEFDIEKKSIGVGGFGVVYKEKWHGVNVAIKKVLDSSGFENHIKEVQEHEKLRFPNIISMYGVCEATDGLWMICEWAPLGDLSKLIYQRNDITLSIDIIIAMLMDIASGMQYLHTREPEILHRDLKSSNLLLFPRCQVKVADFGLIRTMAQSKAFSTNKKGSICCMAPEILFPNRNESKGDNDEEEEESLSFRYSRQSDVWSFAIVMYELICRKEPFQDARIAHINLQNNRRPKIPQEISDNQNYSRLIELMKSCWSQEPLARPLFNGILETLKQQYDTDKAFKDGKRIEYQLCQSLNQNNSNIDSLDNAILSELIAEKDDIIQKLQMENKRLNEKINNDKQEIDIIKSKYEEYMKKNNIQDERKEQIKVNFTAKQEKLSKKENEFQNISDEYATKKREIQAILGGKRFHDNYPDIDSNPRKYIDEEGETKKLVDLGITKKSQEEEIEKLKIELSDIEKSMNELNMTILEIVDELFFKIEVSKTKVNELENEIQNLKINITEKQKIIEDCEATKVRRESENHLKITKLRQEIEEYKSEISTVTNTFYDEKHSFDVQIKQYESDKTRLEKVIQKLHIKLQPYEEEEKKKKEEEERKEEERKEEERKEEERKEEERKEEERKEEERKEQLKAGRCPDCGNTLVCARDARAAMAPERRLSAAEAAMTMGYLAARPAIMARRSIEEEILQWENGIWKCGNGHKHDQAYCGGCSKYLTAPRII